ncbi:MAG: hypothetical protein ACRD2E_01000 [Terriglobales bacterium]
MSKGNSIALWEPPAPARVPDSVTDPAAIAEAALLLRPRERIQVLDSLRSQHFEVAVTFIWQRTMTLLKKQLSALGNEFVGELLQRPDISESTEITTLVSDREAIGLARDLGVLTSTQAMRLVHSHEVVNHFASIDNESLGDEESMTSEEAISCLRVCVQGILGHEKIGVAEDFSKFRRLLESKTFTADSEEVARLEQSPYLFVRTAISVLISVLRGNSGASLEHASRNAGLIIPRLWDRLKRSERWQIGQAYAAEFSEGRKETVRALHGVLVAVRGFDYVPENLRSATFTRVAGNVIGAHQGMNNFYNEPAPMKELASLGTSIPGPALPACMTAALCVRLGNSYGASFGAQDAANEVLASVSSERWIYYLEDRLDRDPIILPKLASPGRPLQRWVDLVSALNLHPAQLAGKDVKALLRATNEKAPAKVMGIALRMYSHG